MYINTTDHLSIHNNNYVSCWVVYLVYWGCEHIDYIYIYIERLVLEFWMDREGFWGDIHLGIFKNKGVKRSSTQQWLKWEIPTDKRWTNSNGNKTIKTRLLFLSFHKHPPRHTLIEKTQHFSYISTLFNVINHSGPFKPLDRRTQWLRVNRTRTGHSNNNYIVSKVTHV